MIPPHAIRRSMRKSYLRARIMALLRERGEMHLGEIASVLGVPHRRVRAALVGELPWYREDLSLVGLGLGRLRRDDFGEFAALTEKGLREEDVATMAARVRGAE